MEAAPVGGGNPAGDLTVHVTGERTQVEKQGGLGNDDSDAAWIGCEAGPNRTPERPAGAPVTNTYAPDDTAGGPQIAK